MDKKKLQLGMNPSTAQHRLRMDVLWGMVKQAGHVCFHCEKPMSRETFSIEHKKPWLDADDPKEAFFDLENIAFSHQSCNYGAARREHKHNTVDERDEARRASNRKSWTSEKRKEYYLQSGK